MASILLGLGALTYDKVKTSRERRRARKSENAARFAELERENAQRLGRWGPEIRRTSQDMRDIQARPRAEGERTGDRGEGRDSGVGGMGGGREERAQRPPEYESLMREEERRGSRGFFGKRGDKAGEGMVR